MLSLRRLLEPWFCLSGCFVFCDKAALCGAGLVILGGYQVVRGIAEADIHTEANCLSILPCPPSYMLAQVCELILSLEKSRNTACFTVRNDVNNIDCEISKTISNRVVEEKGVGMVLGWEKEIQEARSGVGAKNANSSGRKCVLFSFSRSAMIMISERISFLNNILYCTSGSS